ncbi:MAG: hypothetical protein SF182_18680 [Deltaproteobacteria bacterium]|nr:hypothetical protein [Deltaproteobacteria bacterium]
MSRCLAVLAVLLLAAAARAEQLPELNDSPYLSVDTYAADGPFVSWPAQAVGMTSMVIVGGSVATLCMPFDLMRGLQKGNYGGLAQYCGAGAGRPAGNGAYLLVGAPFWAMKKTFWDAPKALF